MQVDPALGELAAKVLDACRARGLTIATAESCTGGLVAALLTSIAGSSDVFERGFVTYSNAAKSEAIGVSANLIEQHGAVSAEVARAMAEGALSHSRADLAVSITGIAGPGGGSSAKPIGLVFVGFARRGEMSGRTQRHLFEDRGREFIRNETVHSALSLLLAKATESG
jgi:nicotinamide-nucleotide amidase